MLFRKIFLLALIPGVGFCLGRQFWFPCHNDTLATYFSAPDSGYHSLVYFVPSPGYMDHKGSLGIGKEGLVPHGGVYDVWKRYLLTMGYAVVSFDKPGTGASSGRLSGQEASALVCVLYAINKEFPIRSRPYFIFTYSSGFDFFRYALTSIIHALNDKKPSGVVFLAGLPSWYRSLEDVIPILSVMGDTSLSARNIEKAKMMFQANWDTLSQVLLVPHADVHLCDSVFRSEEHRCRYSPRVMADVGEWMEKIPVFDK